MNPIHTRNSSHTLSNLTAEIRERYCRQLIGVGLALALYFLQLNRTLAQNQVGYRYEYYREDAARIGVDTSSFLFEQKVTSWLTLQGEAVYDSISGATPTGAPPAVDIVVPFPPPGPYNTTVPLTHMHDQRYAGDLVGAMTFGPHHITPQFAYSTESDYISYGAALNYSLDLNGKNTTLNLGWAHDFDTVYPGRSPYLTSSKPKNTDHILIGVNQLLGPKTVLTGNFTFANSTGYLNDPYRGVLFNGYPQADLNDPALFPEQRPGYRQSYIGFLSLLQFVTPLNGGLEASYRPYYDSFGVMSHTIDVRWHQKIGQRVLLSPIFRYYHQTAADFYATQFPGDPSVNPAVAPQYYSADYRLSKMETFTMGIELNAKVTDWLTLDVAYKRYAMRGLDGVTSQSAYPKANVVQIGARVWF